MNITRKGFLAALGAFACGGALGAGGGATRPANGSGPAKQLAVYHLSEADKVPFALLNINNHIDGVGGPEGADIVVVVHGEGYRGFLKQNADLGISQDVEMLDVQGVRFEVCGLTLDAFKVTVQDLAGDFRRLDEGAVVRLTELQMNGYAYLRP
jgi:intracellular sulfur oxidation DsrE/DsrF family protein